MGPTSAIVLYAVIWFMTLFIILPIRLKTQGDVGDVVPGTHAGAPAETNLKKKALLTTVIAAVLWGIIAGIILTETITVRDLDWFNRMSQPDLS
jgi:predicted secreted protein